MSEIRVSDETTTYKAETLLELLEVCLRFRPVEHVGGWIFRGQSDESWELLPKAGRSMAHTAKGNDWAVFSIWRRKAVAYSTLPSNELECLAIAQHHGLATRLLDWSNNPLIAAFFACNANSDTDGAVYAFFPTSNIDKENFDEKAITEVRQYIPDSVSERIVGQSGRFTYHPDPREPISYREIGYPFIGQQLKKIMIPFGAKTAIVNDLNALNINEATIFPGLDGLSGYLNRL